MGFLPGVSLAAFALGSADALHTPATFFDPSGILRNAAEGVCAWSGGFAFRLRHGGRAPRPGYFL